MTSPHTENPPDPHPTAPTTWQTGAVPPGQTVALPTWDPEPGTALVRQPGWVPTVGQETGVVPAWQTGVLTMWGPGVSAV
ncbi:hypothetical protein ACIBJF_04315, partial [Streptomyces sp. NPDC050743]|uniref:hypothetical protein n=1 Tax=Streptomyces sp. NPDC050743 TaxID=3365634 RepID=UPI0037979E91